MSDTTPWALNIRVVNQSNNPVEMATIVVAAGPVPLPDIAALSGADGLVSISVPCAGEYTVTINVGGRTGEPRQFTAVSDNTISTASPDN